MSEQTNRPFIQCLLSVCSGQVGRGTWNGVVTSESHPCPRAGHSLPTAHLFSWQGVLQAPAQSSNSHVRNKAIEVNRFPVARCQLHGDAVPLVPRMVPIAVPAKSRHS